jgi:hypothetical protein
MQHNQILVQKPLRGKLIRSTVALLSVSFMLAGVVVYFSINKLSNAFLSLSQKRTEMTREELQSFSNSSVDRIVQRSSSEVKARALSLIKKDAGSLVAPFQDNSFAQVKDFVQKVFTGDSDMTRATFFVREGSQVIAWHYVDRQYPKGLDMGIEYSVKDKAWKGTYQGSKVVVPDPEAENYFRKSGLVFESSKSETNAEEIVAFDVVLPVYQKFSSLAELEKSVKSGRAQGNPIGFLRYTIS